MKIYIKRGGGKKIKSRELVGWYTPMASGGGNEVGSTDSAVVAVCRSAKKKRFKNFTKENTGKKKEGEGLRSLLIRWRVW
jgi:hypothetical protein